MEGIESEADRYRQIVDVPVDLKIAPVSAPAVMLPRVSCFPRTASIDELRPLYTRAGLTFNDASRTEKIAKLT